MISSKTTFLFQSPQKLQTDSFLIVMLRAASILAGSIACLIGIFLIKESYPAFVDIGLSRFFSDASWHPTEGLYNLAPMLLGTLLATAGAVAFAAPLGLISGLFVHFYLSGRLKQFYRRSMEILAGIPSVVYGFWGLMVLVPAVNLIQAPGASLLAAIIVLTIMVLPTMALSADAAIESVPKSYLLAGAALGLNRVGMIFTAVLPAARSRFLTGALLATGRAIGETMAVLMVCGNIVQVPESIFDPVRTLTANIALEMAYATGSHRASLFMSGLILLLMVMLLVFLVEVVSKRGRYAD